ncbi:MAG TPA: hypothetical protein VK927_05115, partial [Adhaeribacter sp.]|nr:hypothetical protein [Adhaeribacter sp.]
EVDQHFGYGAEVNFSKQGVTIDNQDLTLNYISVPVMLNLLEGPVTFQGGVYGAVFLNARIRNGQAWKDLTPYFQDTDYGIVLGLNFYPAGPTFISARFNLGLHNINDNLTKPADAVLKNRNIQLSGGYRF